MTMRRKRPTAPPKRKPSTRSHQMPSKFEDFQMAKRVSKKAYSTKMYIPGTTMASEIPTPFSLQQALGHDQWRRAIVTEIQAHIDNGTFVIATPTNNIRVVPSHFVYKAKPKEDGTLDRLKARLVLNGNRQRPGFDCFESYAPVVDLPVMKLLIAYATINRLHMEIAIPIPKVIRIQHNYTALERNFYLSSFGLPASHQYSVPGTWCRQYCDVLFYAL